MKIKARLIISAAKGAITLREFENLVGFINGLVNNKAGIIWPNIMSAIVFLLLNRTNTRPILPCYFDIEISFIILQKNIIFGFVLFNK